MRKTVAVVGVGNLLLRDEGVGVQVLRALEGAGLGEVVDLIDAGTAFLDAAELVAGYSRVIVIDAMRAGGEPGSIYGAVLDDIDAAGQGLAASLHGLGLEDALHMARMGGVKLGAVELIGIEPQDIATGMELSPVVEGAVRRVVRRLVEELSGSSPLAEAKETVA